MVHIVETWSSKSSKELLEDEVRKCIVSFLEDAYSNTQRLLADVKAVTQVGFEEFYAPFPKLRDLPCQMCMANCVILGMGRKIPKTLTAQAASVGGKRGSRKLSDSQLHLPHTWTEWLRSQQLCTP